MKFCICTLLAVTSLLTFATAQTILLDTNETLSEYLLTSMGAAGLHFDSLATVHLYKRNLQLGTATFEPRHEDIYRIAWLFVPIEERKYRRILVDTFPPDTGPACIVAMFSVNADDDKSDEIVVLTSSEFRNHDVWGKFYEVRIYDEIRHANELGQLLLLAEPTAKFKPESEGWSMGRSLRAKYNTEAKIRRRLRELGFRQYSK